MIDSIKKVIEEEINPVLELHNGSCEVIKYEDGDLTIRLNGGCKGCPASKITLMKGILPILQDKFGEKIKGVYLNA